MSIFQALFGNANAANPAPAPAPAPATPAQPAATQNASFPSQEQQTNGATTTAQQQAPAPNPLDSYASLFETKPADPNAVEEPSTAVVFDQQKVQTQLQGMDFMKFANPNDVQAVVQGGEGAVVALGNMMNAMMRQQALMNTAFSANAANRAAEFALNKSSSSLPEMVRGQLTQQEFSDPAMNHPALQPMVKALTQQYQAQFPKATPQDIAKQVKGYLSTVGQVFATPSETAEQPQNKKAADAQDWSTFFG